MKTKILVILSVIFAAVALTLESGVYLGHISAIKKRAKELKEYKEEEEREKWEELVSPLSGSYSGKIRLTKVNSPFQVNDNVFFLDGEVEIEAGVIFYIANQADVWFEGRNVESALRIEGTESLPVKFTSSRSNDPESGDWNRVVIVNCEADVNYAIFEYAINGLRVSSDVNIKNSTFRYNLSNGLIVGESGSSVTHSVEITHCNISNNEKKGLLVVGPRSTAVIKLNVISSNGTAGLETKDYDDVTIKQNNIFDNEEYDLVNSSSRDLDAPDNWWGTTDTAVIDNNIEDDDEVTTYGSVDFDPISDSTFTKAGLE
ncbi:MAG: right-handed parallel beta-helix repeat-containing protein [Elusimicrobia bacterium]|nr:right-handed parallel beta-helix repeat-containing protein [Elusimicrobiota bacterium]